jgi:hypothetical protein
MQARVVAFGLLVVACERSSPSSVAVDEPPQAEVIVPASDPKPTPESSPVPASRSLTELAGPAVAGFVVYTTEQSVVIPTDGSGPVIGEGLWILDEQTAPVAYSNLLVLSEARVRTLGLPPCACLSLDVACTYEAFERRRFDPATGTSAQEKRCECIAKPDRPGYLPPEPEDVDGQVFEHCEGDQDDVIVSLVGGQLFHQGWEWNGACYEGMSVYDATSWSDDLVESPATLDDTGMRLIGCDMDMGAAFAERPWPFDPDDYGSAEYCDNVEVDTFFLRRGELYWVGDNILHAGGDRTLRKRTVTPTSCPSVADPCGDPAPYRELAKLAKRSREFWIANDGSAALVASKTRWELWPAGAATPIAFELPGIDATKDVIGVRVQRDVAGLRALMKLHEKIGVEPAGRSSPTIELAQCPGGGSPHDELSAREWGDLCALHLVGERWAEAQTCCLAGLAVAEEPSVRGALLYNLGRISEDQGADAQAEQLYSESLVVRPDNATTKRRLEKVRRSLQP